MFVIHELRKPEGPELELQIAEHEALQVLTRVGP